MPTKAVSTCLDAPMRIISSEMSLINSCRLKLERISRILTNHCLKRKKSRTLWLAWYAGMGSSGISTSPGDYPLIGMSLKTKPFGPYLRVRLVWWLLIQTTKQNWKICSGWPIKGEHSCHSINGRTSWILLGKPCRKRLEIVLS